MTQKPVFRQLMLASALAAVLAALPLRWSPQGGFVPGFAYGEEGEGEGEDEEGEGDDGNSGSGDGGEGGDDTGDDDDEVGGDDGEDGDDGDDDDDESTGHSGSGGGSGISGGNSGLGNGWFLLGDGTRVEISDGGRAIKLIYANGWREEISGGHYVLRDEENRLVVDRAVTEADYARLQGLLSA